MRSLVLLSFLIAAIWATSIPTLLLINLIMYAVEVSWLRSLLGMALFGGWVGLWYLLLRLLSKVILSRIRKV